MTALRNNVDGVDHAIDAAATAPVKIGIVPAEDVAGGKHICVAQIDPAVAVGMGVGDVVDLDDAATNFDLLGTAEISVGRDRIRRLGL